VGDLLTAFPRTLRASTTRPETVYRRVPGLIAVHGRSAVPREVETVLRFEDPPILVCRSASRSIPPALLEATLTPVYALTPRGAPAVPTGLVLVRFAEGIDAAGRGDQISRLGFAVVEPLGYAPSAAWVRSAAGDISASLSGIPALEALADVVNVEPQMLQRIARR
jgi:hypothetical protein